MESILALYKNLTKTNQIAQLVNQQKNVHIQGLIGSSMSYFSSALFENSKQTIVFLVDDKEEAAYVLNDLEVLLPNQEVHFFPASFRRPYQLEEIDNANVLLRAEVLNKISESSQPIVIVTYPEAVFEKVVSKVTLEKNTLSLTIGDKISIDFINETLFEYQFKRVDFVAEPGEFSVRGGIIDVFSFSNDWPYRIEFFGDEVDSIRTFDVETQLSKDKVTKIAIIPNIELKAQNETRVSVLEFLQTGVLVVKNFENCSHQINNLFQKATLAYEKLNATIRQIEPKDLYSNEEHFLKKCIQYAVVEISEQALLKHQHQFQFHVKPQPSFNKQFDLLLQNLHENDFNGIQNYICCASDSQSKRLKEIFIEIDAQTNQSSKHTYETVVFPLYQGFIDEELQIACYTDHQIFERYHKFTIKNSIAKKQTISLKELTSLSIGDYVTHIDHGIGKFGGLQKIEVDGKFQEAIKLVYAENDIVYVSIHSLHKISKYNGKDGTTPKIYKLGSNAWKTLKQKTKARVKHIAFNLIQLYAKRRTEKGFAFATDSYLQKELESSFIYEDTPDQIKATADVKNDMESARPMDRLVCGDVGFGKTEVAIRAAFKAVDNGKQVAVLVPTTILAYQHFRTFSSRMKDMPVTVDYLNRFRTAKQKTETLKKLEEGKVDILIGTHQLVNKDVKFKDLGLLIIDEEQKFGVNVKDKLKTIANQIDTLTLTATPIPRTLQFSLMAARDLSVIATPPPNRYPIETQVIRLNEEAIRDAIMYEIQRGGQVFFIHNRIENIKEVAGMIQRLVPDAKIGIGHGQMDGKKLEELMLAFIEGEFDVLVATTIIESGLDVPNANTILINNANNFGLSDLHQMRGRVGRSNKKAFCYFITPPYSTMTEEARKRIQALEQFKDLGSGFHIAMKDLEIRGAGDLLGGEQSGFINEIGFETYQKIMNEAIDELKENEFKDLYEENSDIEQKEFVKEFQLDTDIELLFPDNYINNISERLNLYNELGLLKVMPELLAFQTRLIDRFGPLPKQASNLLNSVQLKWKAQVMGLEKLVIKQHKMVGYFIGDQQSDFYQTQRFMKVLQFAQQNANLCKVKEKQTKNGLRLLISFDNIKTIDKANQVLEMFE